MATVISSSSGSSSVTFKATSHHLDSIPIIDSYVNNADFASNRLVAGNAKFRTTFQFGHARSSFNDIPLSLVSKKIINDHIAKLSDDSFKGRNSPSADLDRAAGYISEVAAAYGLRGLGRGGKSEFLQPFSIYSRYANMNKLPLTSKNMGKPGNKGNYGPELFEFAIHGTELARLQSVVGAKPNDKYHSWGKANNVVAVLEGSDPKLKDEYVIVSAHYDHIGERSRGSDKIYNGADDNASGTAALLGMLPALAKMKSKGKGPKRSIVFIWTAAEEKGLIGADYYAKNPLHPMEKTVAAINVDMIARQSVDQISICTKDSNGSQNFLHSYAADAGKTVGFSRVDHDIDEYLRRQDGWIWTRAGIPTAFLFEGFDEHGRLNPDYHGVDDEIDKILKENGGVKAERTAQMALIMLMKAANRN